MTLYSVLQTVKSNGQIDDLGIARIDSHIAVTQGSRNYPWFIKAGLAIGAWVAAFCFLAFFGTLGYLVAKVTLLLMGVFVIAVATLVRGLLKFEFTNQLSLASSIAGHCMIFIWVADIGKRGDTNLPIIRISIASIILCLIMYPLFRDFVHRFLSCFLSQMMVLMWLASTNNPNRIYFLITFQIIGVLFLLAGRSLTGRGLATRERPLACALVVVLLVSIGTASFFPDYTVYALWPAKILFTAMLIYLYTWVVRREGHKWSYAMTTAVVITVALGIMTSPGVLLAIAIMVIGYERKDGLLVGLGVAVFPVFIWGYYYNMSLNLMTKSFILMGSGLILLAARLYMGRFVDKQTVPAELVYSHGAGQ